MHVRNIFAASAAMLLLFPSAALYADDKISEAETLLFETNHLKKITKPEKLHYIFVKSGTLEQNFQDDVQITIDKIMPDGGKYITTEFLSGSKRIEFPPIEDAKSNPVLLWFLERDIREMQRLTGGKSPYFRKRIRIALADHAEVRPVKIAYDGKEVNGNEIKITPYINDELKERFGRHVGKYYLFTLSDRIPGGIYQLRTVDPDGQSDKSGTVPPLIEETLTFSPDKKRVAR
ncbi:MAG TPA: hypothetical protein VEG37_10455 [Burkholderiales bacterium]|nr:hypothetical protein [Burkholderiales bacterium]